MPQYSSVKRSVLTAACTALCVVLRLALSPLPDADAVYCPMHLPVLLCAFCCGALPGLACALLGPVMSFVVCALPSPAYLPAVMAECAVCALVMGAFSRAFNRQGKKTGLLAVLLLTLVLGRLAGGVMNALLYSSSLTGAAALAALWLVKGMPGMIVQLVLLPLVLRGLENASLLPFE